MTLPIWTVFASLPYCCADHVTPDGPTLAIRSVTGIVLDAPAPLIAKLHGLPDAASPS